MTLTLEPVQTEAKPEGSKVYALLASLAVWCS